MLPLSRSASGTSLPPLDSRLRLGRWLQREPHFFHSSREGGSYSVTCPIVFGPHATRGVSALGSAPLAAKRSGRRVAFPPGRMDDRRSPARTQSDPHTSVRAPPAIIPMAPSARAPPPDRYHSCDPAGLAPACRPPARGRCMYANPRRRPRDGRDPNEKRGTPDSGKSSCCPVAAAGGLPSAASMAG